MLDNKEVLKMKKEEFKNLEIEIIIINNDDIIQTSSFGEDLAGSKHVYFR